jgi:heat shock protein HtpX
LPGATSAVMEMCIDNPREGFGELFDTHPSVDHRVAALVKFAGGHDPGPLALPPPDGQSSEPAAGPWGSTETKDPTPSGPSPGASAGPWGPSTETETASTDAPPPGSSGPWGSRPGGKPETPRD